MPNDLIRPEIKHSILGVPGHLSALHRPPAPWVTGVFANQTWISEWRPVRGYGTNGQMSVNIRFDDNCRNGHMSFVITADIVTNESKRMGDFAACGCLHDEIKSIFPEIAPLIKWHHMNTDGMMRYIANTVYHASDRDYNGKKEGEPCAWEQVVYFGNSPVSHKIKSSKFGGFLKARMVEKDGFHIADAQNREFRVIALAHEKTTGYQYSDNFTFVGYGEKWHDCPFSDKQTAYEWALALNTIGARFESIPIRFSDGKARDFNAARSCAVWPDAPDSVFMLDKPELTAILMARHPGLIAAFRLDMENIGFLFACPTE